MKYLSEVVKEQKREVAELRSIVESICCEKIVPNESIRGALLTGSVARGDARVGPHGVLIDIALLVGDKQRIALDAIFGVDEKPSIPFHCVMITETVGLQIQTLGKDDLLGIRDMPEATIFAMYESQIIDDKDSLLRNWKDTNFHITPQEMKSRAMRHFHRFSYLTGDYRFEKWSRRGAWTQIAQNHNEAAECYCSFLHCINGRFIPRKDWIAYLTYELLTKPEKHEQYMSQLYETHLDGDAAVEKNDAMGELRHWMDAYARKQCWL